MTTTGNPNPQLEELITLSPHAVQASADLDDAEASMRSHHVRHLPVLEGDAVVGVLSSRDVETAQGMRDAFGRPHFCVRQACSRPAYVVEVDTSPAEVAREMANRKLGCAVVTAQGKLLGIITTTDLARLYAESLDPKS